MPSRGGVTGEFIAPYKVNITYGDKSAGIARGSGADWFGPQDPMAPIAPPEVASRQWDFPAGFNLNLQPRAMEPVGFPLLRGFADSYDILRLIIETRKDQVARLTWSVKPRDETSANANDPLVAQVTNFLRRPDGLHPFADWLRMLLEDLFVIDAPTLYMQRTYGGKLLALQPLDGATIKPVVDDWGRTPQPYEENGETIYPVAYQQVLKGFPAIDYSVDDVLYRPRNIRTHHAYGFSPVEQILTTVNIALRRQIFTLEYFTSGNIPDSLIGVPESWTPEQIANYQKYWDAYIEGDLAARRHAKFVPGGVAKTFIQTKEPELKGEFDEWLARICCFAFSISPQALTKQMNRASAETQKEIAEEEGLWPVLNWAKQLLDDVIEREFGAPHLEFAWGQDQQIDPSQQAVILSTYVKSGMLTINEARAQLGMVPLSDPVANKAQTLTANGYVGIGAGAAQDEAIKARGAIPRFDKYNPDQPRVPAGQSGGGEWTSGGAGAPSSAQASPHLITGSSVASDAPLPKNSAETKPPAITPVDFSDGFHDAVVDDWYNIFQESGVRVAKEVSLRLIGTGAIVGYADLLVQAPEGPIEAIEVKTGKTPTFTPNQVIYFPLLQLGGHIYSTDPRIMQF